MTAADHTPSPATDGLREAVEALADELHDDNVEHLLRGILAAHTPPSTTQPIHDDDCESRGCTHCEVCGVGVLYGSRCSAHPMLGSSGAVDHSAPPSETATEGVTRVEWGVRGRPGYGPQIATWTTDPGGNTRQYDEALARYDAGPGQLFRRTVTEFAPIVGEWEPVEETQP